LLLNLPTPANSTGDAGWRIDNDGAVLGAEIAAKNPLPG
jgi:hypothetical protein